MDTAKQNNDAQRPADWLYRYKRMIIVAILIASTLAVAVTMVSIAAFLRARLLEDSKAKTQELGEVIRLSFSNLMLVRNPDGIQHTLETIVSHESSIVKVFILNKNGRIAYSSDKRDIGVILDRFGDPSCTVCHTGPVTVPHETTMIMPVGGQKVLRTVEIIYNQKPCQVCHSAADRINGKLIIDRSVRPTYALVKRVELMIAASGLFCLVILIPLLSRVLSKGMDKYITEVVLKSTELSLVYRIVDRLSKTIDMDEARHAVIEIIREILDADQIDIIFPRENNEYGGIVWRKSDNKIDRRMFPDNDPDQRVLGAWQSGELSCEELVEGGTELCMPICKSDARLALIIARKNSGHFDASGISLIKAMGGHIAVAMDNAALYQIAITDELTGLYSQRHFRNFMEKNFARYERYGEKLTLLMIDVDNFKAVNDTYGHPAGDQILKALAQCILRSTRGEDADFRYGGEEFAVTLTATGSAGGEYVAERIRQRIESTAFAVEDIHLNLTVSIGVASCPENATTIRDIISEADKALYHAKKAGKNKVVLSDAKAGGEKHEA
jgi:diguanylate cyclase (GGDEF)-like protein